MKPQTPPLGPRPRRRRIGNLLLLGGVILLLIPLGVLARDEILYRIQMAQAPTLTPLMLSPADSPTEASDLGPSAGNPPTQPPTGSIIRPPTDPAAQDPSDRLDPTLAYQIEIPRIGITYLVGEGVDDPILAKGPGHYSQTALPGEVGNAALAGHRTIRGRPAFFYDLNELQAGDEIRIIYRDRTLTFAVEEVFLTSPYDLSVIDPTPYPALTLTTCDPPGSDEMRLIVQSRLVSETKAAE